MAKQTLSLPKAPATTAAVEQPAPQSAYLGADVIVVTSEKIGGQNEHTAKITRVHSRDIVNVMIFPAEGQPYPVAAINRDAGLPFWRWPSRN